MNSASEQRTCKMTGSTSRNGVTYRVIAVADEGQRIDNYLLRVLRGVPRSRIYRLLRRGEIRVNKSRVPPAYRLNAGDELRIPPVSIQETGVLRPSPALQVIRRLEEMILYEDGSLLVLNKPSGMAAHGGSGIEFGIIEALRALRPAQHDLELCHRLDRETSGCLIVAKRRSALRNLHSQFRQRRVQKQYVALVSGQWERRLRLIDAPLTRRVLSSGERRVEVNFKAGEPSVTAFEIEQSFNHATLLLAMPRTGRTHQIRVHCAYAHHPVGNDEKYGSPAFNAALHGMGLERMFLHARQIIFEDPQSGRTLNIKAPLDPALQHVLEALN